jgi:group I intron endonuclease
MENAKVYKITNDVNDKIYIGSSNNQYLSTRMNGHRQMCKDLTGRRNTKLYNFMREIGVEHFHIELIEKVKCENINQLREREQFHIDILKPELNMFRAIENPNYVRPNREEQNKKNNERYHANKEEYLKKQKEYAEKNKEAISIRRKKYREENKEKIKLQKDKTRDEYNKRRREKRAEQKKKD